MWLILSSIEWKAFDEKKKEFFLWGPIVLPFKAQKWDMILVSNSASADVVVWAVVGGPRFVFPTAFAFQSRLPVEIQTALRRINTY